MDNQYLIKLGPGEYTLTSTLVVPQYISIQGSGRGYDYSAGSGGSVNTLSLSNAVTLLTGAISSSAFDETASLVSITDFTTLSDLGVHNTGTGSNTFAIHTQGISVFGETRIENITAVATGASSNNRGIFNGNLYK